MTDDVNETAAEAPITDEQLAAAFPGQDVAQLRASIGKMDGATAEQDTSDVVYPDFLPDKFREGTVEEATAKMAASYAALEKTLSGKPSAEPDIKADIETPAEASMGTAQAEYLANDGVISPETYAALAAKGMDQEMVDGYISGQQAIAGQLVTKTYAAAGGEEAYTGLLQWAADNWSEEQIDAYDTVINQGNEAAISLAVAGLKSAATANPGPNLIPGLGDQGSNTGPAYQSKQEMTADMRNPLYKTDPAFRKQVEKKLSNSNIW